VSESRIQQSFVQAMRYRESVDSRYEIIAIPNEGKRTFATASRMKSEGLRAGVWDLLLLTPCHGYGGLWLETKSEKGTLSESQKDFWERNKYKYQFSVYRNASEGIEAVERYLKDGVGNYVGGSGVKSKLKNIKNV